VRRLYKSFGVKGLMHGSSHMQRNRKNCDSTVTHVTRLHRVSIWGENSESVVVKGGDSPMCAVLYQVTGTDRSLILRRHIPGLLPVGRIFSMPSYRTFASLSCDMFRLILQAIIML
jgi:hypothetical protein